MDTHKGLMFVSLSAVFIIFKSTFAGFACLSNPCVHGICMDDINSTYSCYCMDGYTGLQCQTNWDECWSSPCLNGGTCIDGIATFNCTCQDGFVGDLCEINYNECDSNPCQNNGTCVDAENGYTCLCHAGYRGLYCEVDVAVCNETDSARCLNGGECVEGPGFSFSCICPPGWTGTVCESEIDECASSPCQNGGICINLHADFECACPFGYTGKTCAEQILICDENLCENDALCLLEDDLPVCYCVPDYHGDRCQYQYDECQLGPRCLNGGTCIDGVDNFTCSCPPDLTGLFCECLIIDDDTMDCTYIRPTITTLLTTVFNKTFATSATKYTTAIFDQTTQQESSSVSTFSSTFSSVPVSSTEMIYSESTTPIYEETKVPNQTSGTDFEMTSTKFLSTDFYSSTSYGTMTSVFSESPSSSSTEASTKFFETLPTFYETTEETTEPTSSETIFTNVTKISDRPYSTDFSTAMTYPFTKDFTFLSSSSSPTSSQTVTEEITPITFEETSYSTLEPVSKTPKSINWTHKATTLEYTTELGTEGSTIFGSSYGTKTTGISFSTEESTAVSDSVTSTTLVPDCVVTPCENGGTCIVTIEGSKCICPFDTEGALCERHLGLKHVAFTGNSYLSYKINKMKDLTIELKANTFNTDGIVFFVDEGRSYMLLYVQNGLPKFQFSCGFQTMLLSELEVPVNTGNDMFIKAHLKFTEDFKKCNAVLTVNGTLNMSGEQVAFVDLFSKRDSWLHVGGIPKEYDRDFMDDLPGFTGCVENIKINGVKQNILKDAVDGFKLSECSSLACLSNPCYNGATCIENNKNWLCECKNGFVGTSCQTSVCVNNPCHFGATCVPYTGSGFLCLCPFGKHGLFCEKDLTITEPMFTSSINGMSSFIGYHSPMAMSNDMEIIFKIKPNTLDQISLLLFIGQHDYHDSTSDHIAVSFVKGYIVLTWNLGSGPRRIFTTQPVDIKENVPHVIHLGRYGRRAWLKVNNFENVTGRSPGKLVHLDVVPIVYLGGHYSSNFTMLPHDLPLHTGFSGCIFDVKVKSGPLEVPLQAIAKPSIGRSLGQCGMIECHDRACQNGGACLQHGPTFTCMCQDGWFGPFCSLTYNPCNNHRHNCSQGSTCVPLAAGYECDCPIGKTGQFCEKDEQISDMSFTGKRSFAVIDPGEFNTQNFILEFEIRPLSDAGLVLFIGKLEEFSFLSVILQGNSLEARIATGKYNMNVTQPLIILSKKLLATGAWQHIKIAISGRKVVLSVDSVINSGFLPSGDAFVLNKPLFYIGGLPDLSTLPHDAISALPTPFKGCVRNLYLNKNHIPLTADTLLSAQNVEDCDGTPCGGEVCKNGGTCWLDSKLTPRCSCTPQYTGDRCQLREACSKYGCENDGECKGDICNCSVGWSGSYCEIAINLNKPKFSGNSFLEVKQRRIKEKRNLKVVQNVPFIHLNFSTASPDGMVLWSAKGEDFFGIGIENGHLKIVWSTSGNDIFVVEVPAVGYLSDGIWHEIKMSLDTNNITIWVDQIMFNRQVKDNEKQNLITNTNKQSYTSDRIFFFGGIPSNTSLTNETFGFFQSNFVGCIELLPAEWNPLLNDFSNFNGENIANCDLY